MLNIALRHLNGGEPQCITERWHPSAKIRPTLHSSNLNPICITLEICWLRAYRGILAAHSHPTLLIEEIKCQLIWGCAGCGWAKALERARVLIYHQTGQELGLGHPRLHKSRPETFLFWVTDHGCRQNHCSSNNFCHYNGLQVKAK